MGLLWLENVTTILQNDLFWQLKHSKKRIKKIVRLMRTCSLTQAFTQNMHHLYPDFLGQGLGNFFGCPDIFWVTNSNAYSHEWTIFWVLWTIWMVRGHEVFGQNQLLEVSFFKQSPRQSLFNCLQLRASHFKLAFFTFECFQAF